MPDILTVTRLGVLRDFTDNLRFQIAAARQAVETLQLALDNSEGLTGTAAYHVAFELEAAAETIEELEGIVKAAIEPATGATIHPIEPHLKARAEAASARQPGRAVMSADMESGADIMFVVPGVPVAWQRTGRRRLGDGRVISFTPRSVENFGSLVKMAASAAMAGRAPIGGAVELTAVASYTPPQSWSRKRQEMALSGKVQKVSAPDAENIIKGVLDSLQGVAYIDDKQVVRLIVSKRYGILPQLEVVVRLL